MCSETVLLKADFNPFMRGFDTGLPHFALLSTVHNRKPSFNTTKQKTTSFIEDFFNVNLKHIPAWVQW